MQKKKLETFFQLLNKGEIDLTQPSSSKSVTVDSRKKITEGIRSALLRELYADSYIKILKQKTIKI